MCESEKKLRGERDEGEKERERGPAAGTREPFKRILFVFVFLFF